MNRFEKKLSARFDALEDLSAITPGVVVDVHLRGKRKGLVRAGDTYPYYDLASLTKIMFTASRAMMHFSAYPDELDWPVREVLAWWKPSATCRDLLSHSAGLEWWLPMYKKLRGPLKPEHRWAQMKKYLARVKPSSARARKAVYSDLDLWMTGAFLEARLLGDSADPGGTSHGSLLRLWGDVVEQLELEDVFFHPGNKPRFARSKYAPTENSPWHKKILRGEVHDENCWALGGVAPHAGLFGTVEAVSDWGLKLRAAYLGKFDGFGDVSMVRQFVDRRVPRSVGDWGLGFMKPSRPVSSCGRYFSVKSFGHTGFTGTSLWFDPVRDLLVVVLSNRVHPTRENNLFLGLRREIHDWVVESLD